MKVIPLDHSKKDEVQGGGARCEEKWARDCGVHETFTRHWLGRFGSFPGVCDNSRNNYSPVRHHFGCD
jgi:hypothetical protein